MNEMNGRRGRGCAKRMTGPADQDIREVVRGHRLRLGGQHAGTGYELGSGTNFEINMI